MKDGLLLHEDVPHLVECAVFDGEGCSCGSVPVPPTPRNGIAGIFVPLGPGYRVATLTAEKGGVPRRLRDGRDDVWYVAEPSEARAYRKDQRKA